MKTLSELRGTPKEVASKLPDPPMAVLLKRKAIRTFPDGQRVALYHNDQLNLDVSVPYYPGKVGGEITYGKLHETIWKKLGAISKGKPADLKFASGAVLKSVQPSVASKIEKLRGQLNTYNQQKLAVKINRSPSDFNEVIKFIRSNDL